MCPILSYSQLSAVTIINDITNNMQPILKLGPIASGKVTNAIAPSQYQISTDVILPNNVSQNVGLRVQFTSGTNKNVSCNVLTYNLTNGIFTFDQNAPGVYFYNGLPFTPAVNDTVDVYTTDAMVFSWYMLWNTVLGLVDYNTKSALKSLKVADTERCFDEDERSTASALYVKLKSIKIFLPPMPGQVVLMSTAFGFKVKWQDKFDTGGSGNTKVVIRDAAGAIQLTSAPHAIAADVYGDQSETIYQNSVAAFTQPLTIEIWGQSTTGGDAISVHNMKLCYDIQDSLPVSVNDS